MSSSSPAAKALQFVVVLAILAGAGGVAYWLYSTKPSAAAAPPREVMPVLVESQTLREGSQPAQVRGYGTVESFQRLSVQPQVDGQVVSRSPELIAGGQFDEGEVLFRIDPRDYELAVEQQKANLVRAEFELQVEEGNQVVAEREWKLLGPTIQTSEAGRRLALREPHLMEKKAMVEAAQSQLEEAKLNLERAVITAPFNAIVLSEDVEIGQLVGPGVTVAQLVNTDAFHVQVSVPVGQLDWVDLPDRGGVGGSPAEIVHNLGNGRRVVREGRVTQRLANVDPNGRLARLLVEVRDPLDLNAPPNRREALLLGSYVQVSINGPELDNVFVIPRRSLREGDRVWIIGENGKLEFRDVSVVQGNDETLTVRGNLRSGEELVTSNLAAPLPGMLVAKAEPPAHEKKTDLAMEKSAPEAKEAVPNAAPAITP
ncbi:MAG: efflux RND transporter periplasmic adaptor subunit [Verrucomicrobiota bacterium]